MAGQAWSPDGDGGYMYSDQLSRRLRTAMQPLARFRRFCTAHIAKGLSSGDKFHWNVYSDVATQGAKVDEDDSAPETKFTITQGEGTITEYMNSIPYTKKLDDLSLQPVTEVIHKVLKNDAAKALDNAAYEEFAKSVLKVVGTSATAIAVTENGTPSTSDAPVLAKAHVRAISDEMAERNIPTYDEENYVAVFRPKALRGLKTELEAVHQYTSEGWYRIMNGEKGRYEGIRFIEQTNISSAVLKSKWKTGTSKTNAAIDAGFFFGDDTVAEGVAIPEEIRARIPTDYGRTRGIAWYALLGFAIVHNMTATAKQGRILHWTSQNA